MDAEGGVAHLSAVERFFQKVAVPIDAEVQIEVDLRVVDVLAGDGADGRVGHRAPCR